ncbi:permease for cytosine/purines, uracil, thiamine, allantoin-domain-containing protein [Mycena filopes]|nr:permease for cytosine/purines, uracil, thiamine, allantoin-domain-containing protein [Mycena filopes]
MSLAYAAPYTFPPPMGETLRYTQAAQPSVDDGQFAIAKVNGTIRLVQVSLATPASALTTVDVKIFRHEFIHIFRYLECRTLHPADVHIIELIDDHHKNYDEESDTVFLAKDHEKLQYVRREFDLSSLTISAGYGPVSPFLSTMTPALKPEKDASETPNGTTFFQRLTRFLGRWGVETHGIAPVPKEERVDPHIYQLFLLWFSANMNIITLIIGATGPVVFKLSLLDTTLDLLVTDALSCVIPAYFAVFGPKLGTRAMVQAMYAVAIPSILNVISLIVFTFFNIIIGGQMLAHGFDHLTSTTGIVIIALVSLVISFCGYRVLHWFEAVAWLPTPIGVCVMLGVGGRHLASAPTYPPPTAAPLLSFAATVAAADLSWCTMTPDYGVYHDADASSARIFTYTYLGLLIPSFLLHVVGAAFAAAAPGVPSWNAGYDHGNDLGGLVAAVLAPTGRFGQVLVVVLALSISGPTAAIVYSFGISLMNVSSVFAKVPRYVYAIVGTGICIPLALVGQTRFYSVLVATFDLIGYWCASFSAIVLTEHILFRRCDFAKYNVRETWNQAERLPHGVAALLAFFGSLALVVPFMAQSWYVGPVARRTGDIGLLVGFFGGCVLYALLRPLDLRLLPGRGS